MNDEEIAQMMRAVGLVFGKPFSIDQLRRFAEIAASRERMVNAEIADTAEPYMAGDLIRARGNKMPLFDDWPGGWK